MLIRKGGLSSHLRGFPAPARSPISAAPARRRHTCCEYFASGWFALTQSRMRICNVDLQVRLDSLTFYVYFSLMMTRKILDTAVSDLAHSIGLLVRRWRAAAPSQELSWTGSLVMARLAKDGAATTADLARAEAMKPQSMGTTIAALEKLGFVERKPHPTDGRQINIKLTPEGAAMRKNAKDAKLTWLKYAIAELDEEERKTLFKAGAIIKRLAQK